MFIIKVNIEGELRKDNGDFDLRSEQQRFYIDKEDISEVVKGCVDIVDDYYWCIPEFNKNEGYYEASCIDNVYPDIEVYWVMDKLWSKFEELDIIPEMKKEWLIGGFCITEAIEDDVELDHKYFSEILMKNNILKWNKEFKGIKYDNDKILGG